MKMKTWQIEVAVVSAVLLAVAIASDRGVIQLVVELVGAGAVALSFCHAQVADRLAEREAARAVSVPLTVTGLRVGDGPVRVASSGALPEGLQADEDYVVTAVQPTILTPVAIVACHRWAVRYLISKEVMWCIYFLAHRSWAALVGVAVFILYPLWRTWWRKGHPLDRPQA